MAQQRFKIFAGSSIGNLNAYYNAEKLANEWLDANPGAKVVRWKTDQKADDEFTEFALTVLVEMSGGETEVEAEETSQGDQQDEISYTLIYSPDKNVLPVDGLTEISHLVEAINLKVQPGHDFTVLIVRDGETIGSADYNCESNFQPYIRCNETKVARNFIEILNEEWAKQAPTYKLLYVDASLVQYDPTRSPLILLNQIGANVPTGEMFEIGMYRSGQEVGHAIYKRVHNIQEQEPNIAKISEERDATGLLDRLNAIRDSQQESNQDQGETIRYEIYYGPTSEPKIATTVAELADMIVEHVEPNIEPEETYSVYVTKDGETIGGGFYTSGSDEYNETGAAEGLKQKIEEIRTSQQGQEG